MRTTCTVVRLRHAALVCMASAALLTASAATAWPERMVEIRAQVVEITRSDLEKLGFDPSSVLDRVQTLVVSDQTLATQAGTAAHGKSRLDAWLAAGQKSGSVTVLSSQSLLAGVGQSTGIQLGGAVPSATGPSPGAFEIDLELISKIDPIGAVVLDLQARRPTIDLTGLVPRLGSTSQTATARVPDGGSVVLRGLMPPDAHALRARIPGLGDLPALGTLFKSRSFEDRKSDLAVFITPRIIGEEGSGGGGGAVPQSAGGPTTPQSLLYGQVDYFGTQSEASRRPDFPLVTSKPLVLVDNPATGHPFLGELSGPHTESLYDDNRPSYGFASGFKGAVGGWLGRDSDWGAELSGFWVPSESTSKTLRSGQPNSFFSVPFFDTARDIEYAIVLGSDLPGQPVSPGAVSVGSSLDLWGVGGRVRKRGCGCGDVDLGFSAGFRYLRLRETFQIDYATDSTLAKAPPFFGSPTLEDYLFVGGMVPGVGSRVWAQDRVSAQNDFYGFQLGLDAKVKVIPDLTLTISPSVALGANRERLDTSGWGRAVDPAGTSYATPYGVFARPGAVGSRSETNFAVVPEIDLQFAYQISENFELRLGYDFLFLSDMVWAGNQLSRSIDAPFGGSGAFSAQPLGVARPFETQTFWAQSFNAGVHLYF